jgi:holin (3TMs family)
MSILTDISSGAVGGLLGGIGKLASDIRTAITGDLSPEKQAEITQKLMDLESSAMTAQTSINLEEAKSEKLFVAGWRPFIGWVCGSAFAYAAIIEPFLTWLATVYGYTGKFPVLNTEITMQVLIGILGLGAYRSYDKKQAPSAAGKE